MSRRRPQPIFYYVSNRRLIGRLTHLFYGLRFSRQVGGKFITVWNPPTRQYAHYDDPPSYLLENIFDLDRWRAQTGDYLSIAVGLPRRNASWLDSMLNLVRPRGNIARLDLGGPEFALMRPDGFDRSYFSDRDVETFATQFPYYQFSDEKKSKADINLEMAALFRSVPLTADVQEALTQAKDAIGGERFVAVHVRRGDVCDLLRDGMHSFIDGTLASEGLRLPVTRFVTRAAPPAAYFPDIARAISARQKVVFTADVPEAIVPFEKHFGSEHFIDLAKLIKVAYPIQKAFCDFSILTMAEQIVSTGSTLARTASILGNSQLRNVTAECSVEDTERFAIQTLAPQLSAERKMREALLIEIAKTYATRNVDPGGRLEIRRQRSAAEQEQRLAERNAAVERKQQRLAEQKAAAERKQQRLAEQKAAAELKQQRLAEQKAAAELKQQRRAAYKASVDRKLKRIAHREAAANLKPRKLLEL